MPLKDPVARKAYQKKAYAAYYAKNREAVLAKNKAWRKANPDKNAEYRERWLAKPGSIETQRATCRNWRANGRLPARLLLV